MKFVIVFVLIIATALAAPAGEVEIVKQEEDVRPDGYKFAFETSDGTKREEEAVLKNAGAENEAISVRGSFSFVAEDGQTYTINFVADENGYQPEGAHLPVGPS